MWGRAWLNTRLMPAPRPASAGGAAWHPARPMALTASTTWLIGTFEDISSPFEGRSYRQIVLADRALSLFSIRPVRGRRDEVRSTGTKPGPAAATGLGGRVRAALDSRSGGASLPGGRG